jgi:hypothetical protein
MNWKQHWRLMQSKAATVEQYLSGLPAERREALEAVRSVLLANLDKEYEEGMQYGMIGYYVPHRTFPPGYHCDPKQPLSFAALASQKNYMSLYLMCVYGHAPLAEWFRQAWSKTGKKLNMGKACLRFKKVEDLALDVIAEVIRRVPVKKYLQQYEQTMRAVKARTTKGPPAKKGVLATKSARPSRKNRKS